MHYNPDSVASAYAFFHQKWRVYAHSSIPSQKDDIEYAISSYVESMDRNLYKDMAGHRDDFLVNHVHFSQDMKAALAFLGAIMQ